MKSSMNVVLQLGRWRLCVLMERQMSAPTRWLPVTSLACHTSCAESVKSNAFLCAGRPWVSSKQSRRAKWCPSKQVPAQAHQMYELQVWRVSLESLPTRWSTVSPGRAGRRSSEWWRGGGWSQAEEEEEKGQEQEEEAEGGNAARQWFLSELPVNLTASWKPPKPFSSPPTEGSSRRRLALSDLVEGWARTGSRSSAEEAKCESFCSRSFRHVCK